MKASILVTSLALAANAIAALAQSTTPAKQRITSSLDARFAHYVSVADKISPERAPIAGQEAGHACGHHLFGTASTAAALSHRNP